jgi:predicted transcriptional regulator
MSIDTQRGLRSEARTAVLRALGPEPQTTAEIAERVAFSGQAVRWAQGRLLLESLVERNTIPGGSPRWCYGWRMVDAAAMPKPRGRA